MQAAWFWVSVWLDGERLARDWGAVMGVLLGFGIAQMLVKILTGEFDPPPEGLSVPWLYLMLLGAACVVSIVVAVIGAQLASRQSVVESLRNV